MKTKFIANIVGGYDSCEEATDEQMAQLFGEDWENTETLGLEKRLNKLLLNGWYYEFKGMDSVRRCERPGGMAIVFSSPRQTTTFYLNQLEKSA